MSDDLLSKAPTLDTSGYVDHLRLIHFTLMAACLIIVIAATSQELSSAARAYDQTTTLIKLNDRWNAGKWIKDFIAARRAQTHDSPNAVVLEAVDPSTELSKSLRYKFTFDGRALELSDVWRLTETGSASPISIGADFRMTDDGNDYSWNAPHFVTLDGAEKIWSRLDRFRELITHQKIIGGWYLWHNADNANWQTQAITAKSIEDPKNSDINREFLIPGFLLREDLIQLLKRGPFWGSPSRPALSEAGLQKERYDTFLRLVEADATTRCYLFLDNHDVLLRAQCTEAGHLSLQSSLLDGISSTVPIGDFSQSFPDVEELAKHLSSLSLNDLQLHFLSERNRTGETVELPILKLPERDVTSWGIVILAVLVG